MNKTISKDRNFNVSLFIAPKEQVQKSVKTAMDGSFRNFERCIRRFFGTKSQGQKAPKKLGQGWPNLCIAKFGLVLLIMAGLWAPELAMAAGNISENNQYAYIENAEYVNFMPTNGGVTVNDTYLSGYAWAENIGYVKLGNDNGGPYNNTSSTDWGVNNDGSGNLSGYAWAENAGWINFNPSDSQVTIDSTTGSFGGYAWSGNLGWVYFASSWPSIPTLSEWGMLIFIVLLLFSGILKKLARDGLT